MYCLYFLCFNFSIFWGRVIFLGNCCFNIFFDRGNVVDLGLVVVWECKVFKWVVNIVLFCFKVIGFKWKYFVLILVLFVGWMNLEFCF